MDKVVEIASKHLGKTSGYSSQYDPSLLVKVPRALNREKYGIRPYDFVGFDVWNAYEVSCLTSKGLPVSGVMKIVYSSSSQYHVESKSLKLYFNSFNMTEISYTVKDTIRNLEDIVAKDLSELLETKVTCKLFTEHPEYYVDIESNFDDLSDLVGLESIDFRTYSKDPELGTLGYLKNEVSNYHAFKTNLLRSNCRVTNQPDWGDLYVAMDTSARVDYKSIAAYIIGHREINHFHEEMCELIYRDFMKAYEPTTLVVACQYTRRGGIDINPVRMSDRFGLFNEDYFKADRMNAKTLRQ